MSNSPTFRRMQEERLQRTRQSTILTMALRFNITTEQLEAILLEGQNQGWGN